MSKIAVTPEHLMSVSKQFKEKFHQTQQIIATLESQFGSLSGWEGQRHNRMVQSFGEWKKATLAVVANLDVIANELQGAAKDFAAADGQHV